MENKRYVPGAEQHRPDNNGKPKRPSPVPLRPQRLALPRPPLILLPVRPLMRVPVEMRRVRPVERVLPEPHAPHPRALLVRGPPLLAVRSVAPARVEAIRRAAEGAARAVRAAARETRGRAPAGRGGGRVVVRAAVRVGVGVAEVAVVGGTLGGRGEDGVGLGDADEAFGRVGIRGVAVRVVELGESVEGSVSGRRLAVGAGQL